MWDCPHCNCQAIAGSIMICPMCGKPRDMSPQDVTAGPGQTAGGSLSAVPMGSPAPESGSSPSGDVPAAVPPSPKSKKTSSDWGKS
jgi:hypothetical protein